MQIILVPTVNSYFYDLFVLSGESGCKNSVYFKWKPCLKWENVGEKRVMENGYTT